ncbi:MAG: periplasmic heavy metal sensor [bacterium]|nr:periplasmic heavy metal sensor [bacterium]
MKQKLIFAAMGILALSALPTFAHARPGDQGERGPGMMHQKMMSELNLTEEQKSKLQTMRTAHQKEMVKLQATAKLAQIDLREALHQDNPPLADVKAKIAASNAARNTITEAQILNRLASRKVFTAEQLKKMEAMRSMRHNRPDMRDGRPGQGPRQHFRGRPFKGNRGPGMIRGNFDQDTSDGIPPTGM